MTDILDPSGLFLFAQSEPGPNDDGTGVILIVIMGVYFVTAGDDDGHSPDISYEPMKDHDCCCIHVSQQSTLRNAYNHVLSFVFFSNLLCTTKQQSKCSIAVAFLGEEHGIPEVGRERQIQEIPKKHIYICETVISGNVRSSHIQGFQRGNILSRSGG